MHRSLITFIFEGRKISSFSWGGIKLICKDRSRRNIFTITFGEVPPSPNYAYEASKAIILSRNFTFVSTEVAPISDRLRTINKIWLEASISIKRAPSSQNSFYRNKNKKIKIKVNLCGQQNYLMNQFST